MNIKPPEINPDDLEPTIDIDLSVQKKILQLYAILATADHYTLLGLTPSAEKKEIKAAYFERMNLFHTDKFYGKNIGSFGPKLQKIVQTLTKASDTLSRKKTRAEYDAYLSSRTTTIGARTSVAPAARSSHPPAAADRPQRPAVAPVDIFPQIPRAPRAPQVSDPRPPPANQQVSPSNMTSPPSAPVESKAVVTPPRTPGGPASQDAARRMLARKMGARAARPGATPNATAGGQRPSPPPAASTREALEADLRQRFDARRNPGKLQIDKYVKMADDAVNQENWSEAVSAIRLAAQAAPDDPKVQTRLQEIQSQADRALAPQFLAQAKYEEKDGRPERAARSYERAARGTNSAELFEKAARCLLKVGRLSDSDKRKVVEMARKSVTLDNRAADYRLTLARAYDVAGMRTSAQGEVRRALELEPNNKDAKELQKALK